MVVTPRQIGMIPFFHSFESDQVRAITAFFELKKYAPGETILAQNSINIKLYFLLSGSVSIYINDNFIVDLDKVGEVFGEMSLANHSTCSATVKAKSDCEFLVFSFEDMRKSIDPKLKDVVLKNFYKGAMEILAAKLLATNQRK